MHLLLLPFRLLFVVLRLIVRILFHLVRTILLAVGYLVHLILRGTFFILGLSDDVPIAIFSAFTRLLSSPKKFFAGE